MSSCFAPRILKPLAALLAFSLLLGPMAETAALAKSHKSGKSAVKEAPWPARDFLPPVASINSKIDPARQAEQNADNDVEAVTLVGVNTPTLNKTPRVQRLSTDIGVRHPDAKTLAQLQEQVSTADLNRLWEATVERNPVIRFSLEKLAAPADLRPKQSSEFAKRVLGPMISLGMIGASMYGPNMNGYGNMGNMAIGNALQNMVQGRTQPTPGALSPTEQIQMAGLVDELKMKLIHGYQEYRTSLQSLADSHTTTMKNNNMYSQALSSKNDLAIMAAGTAYYQSLNAETALRQKAKMARLQLERLAGPTAVDDLQLAIDVTATPAANAASEPTAMSAVVEPAEPAASLAKPLTPVPTGLDTMEIGPSMDDATVGPAPLKTPPVPTAKAKASTPSTRPGLLQPMDPAIAGGRPHAQ